MGRGHAGVAAAALMLDMAVAHMRTDKVVPFPADLQFCFLFINHDVSKNLYIQTKWMVT